MLWGAEKLVPAEYWCPFGMYFIYNTTFSLPLDQGTASCLWLMAASTRGSSSMGRSRDMGSGAGLRRRIPTRDSSTTERCMDMGQWPMAGEGRMKGSGRTTREKVCDSSLRNYSNFFLLWFQYFFFHFQDVIHCQYCYHINNNLLFVLWMFAVSLYTGHGIWSLQMELITRGHFTIMSGMVKDRRPTRK